MTKEWVEKRNYPKFFKWNNVIWHEDDFYEFMFKLIPSEEKFSTHKDHELSLVAMYDLCLAQAVPLTEEEWQKLFN